jgi:hypothetical protein
VLEHVEVVVGHLIGFVDACEVLAEVGQDGRDALRLLHARGPHGIVEALAGHEARHRATHERRPGRPFAQPGAGGRRQQSVSRKAHLVVSQ